MRNILVLGFLFLYLVLLIPVHLILRIIGIWNPNLRYKLGNAFVYHAFRFELLQAGAHIAVEGKDKIPDKPVLFVSNHRSYFDILLLHTTSGKRPGFVAKAEMDKFPLLNWWMKDIGCLFLDRKDLRSGVQMIKDGAEHIKNGRSMVICPEGTRNQEKEMLPFKEGSLKMADKAECPVVPVAIIDSDQMLEVRPGFHIKSGHPKVIYGEPFYIKELEKEDRKHAGAYAQGLIKKMIDDAGGQTGIRKEKRK